jgi:nucleotide-binding universal stress UspA family protein
MILLCYDGSDDARAAIEVAATLFPGQPAMVITVWEPVLDVMARTGGGLGAAMIDPTDIDAASETAAGERAAEGAEHAREAGFDAQSCATVRRATTAATILDEARDRQAAVIVVGTRGLTGIKSLMLGSVSHAVVQHADRAVVVIPSPEVAEHRRASAGS